MKPAVARNRARHVLGVRCLKSQSFRGFVGIHGRLHVCYRTEHLPESAFAPAHVVSVLVPDVRLSITGRGPSIERAEDRLFEKYRAFEAAASKIRACLEHGDASGVVTRVVPSEEGHLVLLSAKSAGQIIRLAGVAATECDAWVDLRERWMRLSGALETIGEFLASARPPS